MADPSRTERTRSGLVLGLATLLLYAWLAPAHIVDGDNAEMSTLAVTGGAAHPSGYPLYILWLRAMSWLPGSAAHGAALATAILGALTVVVLHAACRAWGARPLAATVAVVAFAAGPVVMRLSCEAEVFALNNLVVASVLWLTAARGPVRGAWRAALLGLVAGLGMANHLTCTLAAPVGLLGIARGMREARGSAIGVAALAAAGVVLGLVPYAYLLVAPSSAISWGHASSASDLLGFITRRDYGGIGSFSAEHGEVDPAANLGALARTLGRGLLWLPAVIAIATLAACAIRRGARTMLEPRRGWAMLATSWLVAGPLLAARFNIAPVMIGRFICERFHLLPLLLLVIPAAVGIDQLALWIARGRPAYALSPALHAAIAVVGLAGVASLSLSEVEAVHSAAVEASARNTLRPLPPGAVVIVGADDLHFGALYVQETLGERRDVIVILVPMLRLPWYRARIAERGVALDPFAAGDGEPSVRIARQVLALGRPLFIDVQQEVVRKTFSTYPLGTLFRVVPEGTAPPSLDDIIEQNRAAFASFDLDYAVPGPDDGYPTGVQGRYLETWSVIARALATAGRTDEAREITAFERALAPR